MLGKEHGGDGDDEDERREEDGALVHIQQFVVLIAVYQSVHHEDAVVDTNTEDERRDDDVQQVETHAEDVHCSQDYQPREDDRHETEQCVLNVPLEADEEYDEYERH